jgi:hypothetical protein
MRRCFTMLRTFKRSSWDLTRTGGSGLSLNALSKVAEGQEHHGLAGTRSFHAYQGMHDENSAFETCHFELEDQHHQCSVPTMFIIHRAQCHKRNFNDIETECCHAWESHYSVALIGKFASWSYAYWFSSKMDQNRHWRAPWEHQSFPAKAAILNWAAKTYGE